MRTSSLFDVIDFVLMAPIPTKIPSNLLPVNQRDTEYKNDTNAKMIG